MWLYSEIKSLADIPRHYARTTPERPALIDASGPTSWAELDARSNRVANLLRKQGVASGDRVAFLGKNTALFFEVLFGTHKANAALLPLNWRLAPPELAAIIEDAQPSLIIADQEYAAILPTVAHWSGKAVPTLVYDSANLRQSQFAELTAAASTADPALEINPWSTAILMYTSGTTGKPKGVQLSHQGTLFLRLCEHLETSFRYQADDVMLTVMPLFHAMGSSLSLQALYNGVPVAVYAMPDPGELLKLIARDRPTVLPLVPTVIQMLLDHPDAAKADFSAVRAVIYAGSGIGAHLLKRALTELQCDFIQFYGATETACGVTFLRPEDHDIRNEQRLKSCGSPLPLIEIKVCDLDGREVPRGTVGELLIRSPSLTTGYFNQPKVTAAAFRDGWYCSGDGGYQDEDGYLYIVDRIKDMIVSGGENVYSTEVEQALQKLGGVQCCAAVGLPDAKWGERVTAVIVADPAAGLTADAVVAHCRTLIAGYKVPKQVEFVASLPMTPSGKVMKRALREQLLSRVHG